MKTCNHDQHPAAAENLQSWPTSCCCCCWWWLTVTVTKVYQEYIVIFYLTCLENMGNHKSNLMGQSPHFIVLRRLQAIALKNSKHIFNVTPCIWNILIVISSPWTYFLIRNQESQKSSVVPQVGLLILYYMRFGKNKTHKILCLHKTQSQFQL